MNLLQEKPTIGETFLDAVHVQGEPTGAIIGNHILNILLKQNGQAYDGASAMVAKVKARRLLSKYNSHELSLLNSKVIV